jgi:hypothetical protein
MRLLWIILLLWSTIASAAERREVQVLTDGVRAPGTYSFGPIAVLPGETRVSISIDRTNLTDPLSQLEVKLEAAVNRQWIVIKAPPGRASGGNRAPGGVPQLTSHTGVTMPVGTEEIRGSVRVIARNARFPTKLIFE